MTHIQLFLLGSVLAVAIAGTYIIWGPSKRKYRKTNVPGLQNLGNTCFLNAILQALAACPLFIIWLKKVIDERHISYSLCSVLLSLLEELNSNFGICSASEVVTALKHKRWVISNDEQDAHELFHVLTATLEEETSEVPPMLSLLEVSKLEPLEGREKNFKCQPILRNLKNTLPVRGLLANQLICQQCGYKYPVKYDTFDSISLTIPSPHWGPLTLQDCLKKFVSCEQVSDVSCDFCCKNQQSMPLPKQKTTFIKQMSFGKLPECLCFHLQRTVWMGSISVKCFDHIVFPEFLAMDSFMYRCPLMKSNREGTFQVTLTGGSMEMSKRNEVTKNADVDVPSNFDVTPLLADKSFHSSDHLYILKAVVVHVGDLVSGHFVTYRRHSSNKKWFFASDSSTNEVLFSEVSKVCAYMLFYERVLQNK